MKGSEYLKKVKKLAKAEQVPCSFDKAHVKGSHGTLYYNGKSTTLKDLKKEIGKGLLDAMCEQLSIDKTKLKE